MHVCKNDVKKKAAAECSENEPPRILMQNEDLNPSLYALNGYDKTNTNFTFVNPSGVVQTTQRSNGGAATSRAIGKSVAAMNNAATSRMLSRVSLLTRYVTFGPYNWLIVFFFFLVLQPLLQRVNVSSIPTSISNSMSIGNSSGNGGAYQNLSVTIRPTTSAVYSGGGSAIDSFVRHNFHK